MYVVTKTANSIKEFRYRIREDKIVEHEIVNPAFTVMASNKLFSFCTAKFVDEFKEFKINTSKEIERTKNKVSIGNVHSLVDGIHVGDYFNRIQEILDNPEKYL